MLLTGEGVCELGTSFPERSYDIEETARVFATRNAVTVAIGFTLAGITFIAMLPMLNKIAPRLWLLPRRSRCCETLDISRLRRATSIT